MLIQSNNYKDVSKVYNQIDESSDENFNCLPEEIIINIFNKIQSDFSELHFVCKKWQSLVDSELFYKDVIHPSMVKEAWGIYLWNQLGVSIDNDLPEPKIPKNFFKNLKKNYNETTTPSSESDEEAPRVLMLIPNKMKVTKQNGNILEITPFSLYRAGYHHTLLISYCPSDPRFKINFDEVSQKLKCETTKWEWITQEMIDRIVFGFAHAVQDATDTFFES